MPGPSGGGQWGGLELILFLEPIATQEFRGGAFVAPRPPDATAVAVVEFLPLAPVVLCIHRRAPVNPNPLGFPGGGFASRAAEVVSVNCLICPFGWGWIESFHVLSSVSRIDFNAGQKLRGSFVSFFLFSFNP